jgi:cytochrome c peroxidase
VVASRARLILLCAVFAACAFSQEAPGGLSRTEVFRRTQALAALGRKMFFDPSLSASGKMSCASCHDPRFAYGPPNAMPVQSGGKDMKQWGIRAAPSLKYLQVIPQFTEHYFDSENTGDDSVDNGPTGGLTWDGRVDRGRDQARIPLLSPYEMANESPAGVVASVQKSSYAGELRQLLAGCGKMPSESQTTGEDACPTTQNRQFASRVGQASWPVWAFFRTRPGGSPSADINDAFNTILEAFETWEQDYKEFYPYSSKYDEWLAGKVRLSDQEQRGLKLFSDPAKGDCARCHVATRGANGAPPQFTDYGLIALGAPRNTQIPANSDPAWYDLGLCGPERTDLHSRDEYCGRFMTPSLRNVATRKTFFHNGVFHSLKDVVEFYVQRDTNPEKWYPRNANGSVLKFNDLPLKYQGNIETGPPFGGEPGGKPALSAEEIQDVVAFLETLTDGSKDKLPTDRHR